LKVVLLAIVLAIAAQPAVAKQAHRHHANKSAVTATPKARTGKADVKAVGRPDSHQSPGSQKSNETPAAIAVPRPASPPDKGQGAKAGVKIVAPDHPQVRHAPSLSAPTARDAIGMPLVRHDVSVGKGGAGVGSPVGVGAAATITRPSAGVGGPRHASPMTGGNMPSTGRIGGTSLIRSATAPTGLGGPAKTVVGINGTTVRSKH
jgi:hypothetical protein